MYLKINTDPALTALREQVDAMSEKPSSRLEGICVIFSNIPNSTVPDSSFTIIKPCF